jgi:pSer/pThr/pTyr-binding forkhead associated (FHA) protein
VLESASTPPEMKKVITKFPCLIGRDGCDFNLPTDQHISRQHVEISVRGDRFFISDLESRNGTFIGETRLSPRTPTPLNGATIVRLGRRTRLKLEPQT